MSETVKADDGPDDRRPSRWERRWKIISASALPAAVALVEIGHEVWQWTHGQ